MKAEEKVGILCIITKGTPPFRIEWTKNGNVIQSDENIKIKKDEEDSVLTIKSSKESDAGNYTCSVKNAFGSDSSTSQVLIRGKAMDQSVMKLIPFKKHLPSGFRGQVTRKCNKDHRLKSSAQLPDSRVQASLGRSVKVLHVHDKG